VHTRTNGGAPSAYTYTIQSETTKPPKKKVVTFATVELKAIAEEVLHNLKTDPATAAIASEVVETVTDKSLSLFNTRLAHITQIKNRQVHDYLQVCLIRLQTIEHTHIPPISQKRAQDQLSILKALLSL
jgi:hypothetical protein